LDFGQKGGNKEPRSGIGPRRNEEQIEQSAAEEEYNREKLAKIAEIVEIMEETHTTKDWLINQIRLKRQKIPLRPTMTIVGVLKACSFEFITDILAELRKSETEDFEHLPPLTKTYHWFFTDIVSGSDPSITTNDQARKIMVLNKLIERIDTFRKRDQDETLVLPTGDGMAIGFADSPEKPLNLAIEVHKGLNRYNEMRVEKDRIYIRIGLDSGPVYVINDLNGNENVWGPGIIMARRVMDLAGKMNILASARFANDVKMLRPEYKPIMHPVGDYQIKHGDRLLIYNIYSDEIGNKKAPSRDMTHTSKAAQEVVNTKNKFLFNEIKMILDIQDPEDMATKHTMIWNMTNVLPEPVDRIFVYIDGDAPKPFADLNVSIKDEKDNELEIISLNVNKPYHKEFFVKAKKPLKQGEKNRFIKIEYDWEEPERQFEYFFASECKKFSYLLRAPKSLELNQKVVKVDKQSGEKTLAPIPAAVRYLESGTEVYWSKEDIHAFEVYRFDW
jgi:hypothetical protein